MGPLSVNFTTTILFLLAWSRHLKSLSTPKTVSNSISYLVFFFIDKALCLPTSDSSKSCYNSFYTMPKSSSPRGGTHIDSFLEAAILLIGNLKTYESSLILQRGADIYCKIRIIFSVAAAESKLILLFMTSNFPCKDICAYRRFNLISSTFTSYSTCNVIRFGAALNHFQLLELSHFQLIGICS